MNKTLQALAKKLSWQIHEVEQKLTIIEQQLRVLNQQREEILQKIHNANVIPTLILPEKEISRLHFIIAQQQQQDALNAQQNILFSEQKLLKSRQLRLNIELKMLEKYQKNKENTKLKQVLLKEQHQTDEWILQNMERT